MLRRSRAAQFSVLLAAAFALVLIAVVSISSHEEDDPLPGGPQGGEGPRRGAAVAMPTGLVGLEITLGIKDQTRTEWEGEVSVSEGRIAGLDIVRATPDSTVDGGRFKVATAKKAANKKAANKKKAAAKKKAQPGGLTPSVIHANLDAPATATVTVRTAKGTFAFKPAELSPAGPKLFLDGEASVELQEAAVRLTGRVLGATVVAPRASEMITLLTAAVSHGLSLYKLSGLIFPYPVLSEGIKKAADAFVFETLPNLPRELGGYLRYRWVGPPTPDRTAERPHGDERQPKPIKPT